MKPQNSLVPRDCDHHSRKNALRTRFPEKLTGMCAANTVRNVVAAYIVSESNGRLALTDVCAQANKRLKYTVEVRKLVP